MGRGRVDRANPLAPPALRASCLERISRAGPGTVPGRARCPAIGIARQARRRGRPRQGARHGGARRPRVPGADPRTAVAPVRGRNGRAGGRHPCGLRRWRPVAKSAIRPGAPQRTRGSMQPRAARVSDSWSRSLETIAERASGRREGLSNRRGGRRGAGFAIAFRNGVPPHDRHRPRRSSCGRRPNGRSPVSRLLPAPCASTVSGAHARKPSGTASEVHSAVLERSFPPGTVACEAVHSASQPPNESGSIFLSSSRRVLRTCRSESNEPTFRASCSQ